MKKCSDPRCPLVSPDSAEFCDCGHSFAGQRARSVPVDTTTANAAQTATVAGVVCLVLSLLSLMAVAFGLRPSIARPSQASNLRSAGMISGGAAYATSRLSVATGDGTYTIMREYAQGWSSRKVYRLDTSEWVSETREVTDEQGQRFIITPKDIVPVPSPASVAGLLTLGLFGPWHSDRYYSLLSNGHPSLARLLDSNVTGGHLLTLVMLALGVGALIRSAALTRRVRRSQG